MGGAPPTGRVARCQHPGVPAPVRSRGRAGRAPPPLRPGHAGPDAARDRPGQRRGVPVRWTVGLRARGHSQSDRSQPGRHADMRLDTAPPTTGRQRAEATSGRLGGRHVSRARSRGSARCRSGCCNAGTPGMAPAWSPAPSCPPERHRLPPLVSVPGRAGWPVPRPRTGPRRCDRPSGGPRPRRR